MVAMNLNQISNFPDTKEDWDIWQKMKAKEREKKDIMDKELGYKFEKGELVKLRAFLLPFISNSLGKIQDRKMIQHITPFGVITRQYYDIEPWIAKAYSGTYTFPAWRLKIDKQQILKHKITGEDL